MWCVGPLLLLIVTAQEPAFRDERAAISTALEAGAYDRAEAAAAEWATRVEGARGRDSLESARAFDLLVETLIRNGRAAASATLPLAERIVAAKERLLERNDPDIALSLHNLGDVHANRGELSAALALHERGLAIRLKGLASDDGRVAESLERLAFTLIQMQRFPDATQRLADALRIRDARSSDAPAALAHTLTLVGLLHRVSGTYAEAVTPLERALAIRKTLTFEHPETTLLLQTRGDVRFLMGDIRGAQDTWSSALGIAERTLRPDHPSLAELLRRLGFAAFSVGNFGEARQFRERALQVGERSLAPCDAALGGLVGAVAMSSRYDGDYATARRLYRRARLTLEKCAGKTAIPATDAYATALYNEAGVAEVTGD